MHFHTEIVSQHSQQMDNPNLKHSIFEQMSRFTPVVAANGEMFNFHVKFKLENLQLQKTCRCFHISKLERRPFLHLLFGFLTWAFDRFGADENNGCHTTGYQWNAWRIYQWTSPIAKLCNMRDLSIDIGQCLGFKLFALSRWNRSFQRIKITVELEKL